MVSGTNFDQHS